MLRRAGIELAVLLVDDDSPDGTAAHRRRDGRPPRPRARGDDGARRWCRGGDGRRVPPTPRCRRRRLHRHAGRRRLPRRPPDHRPRADVPRPPQRAHDRFALGARRHVARQRRRPEPRQPHRQHARATGRRVAAGPRRDDVVLGRAARRRAHGARRWPARGRLRLLPGVRRPRPGVRVQGRRGADRRSARAYSDIAALSVARRQRLRPGDARDPCPHRRGAGQDARRPGDVGGPLRTPARPGGRRRVRVRRRRRAGAPRRGRALLRLDRRRAVAAPRATHPRGRRRHRHRLGGAAGPQPGRRGRPRSSPRPASTRRCTRARPASRASRRARRRRRTSSPASPTPGSTRSSTSTCSSTSGTTPASWRPPATCSPRAARSVVFVPAMPAPLRQPRLQVRAPSPLPPRRPHRAPGRAAASRSSTSATSTCSASRRTTRCTACSTSRRSARCPRRATTAWSCRSAAAVQRLVPHPPFGKNLVAIARKR